MSMKPRNVLVAELFDVTYTCSVKAVYMDICHTPPDVAPMTTGDFTNTAAGCFHTVDNSNERHILKRCLALPDTPAMKKKTLNAQRPLMIMKSPLMKW